MRAADTGETVFRYNSEKSFIPASNNKILSSVAALSLLGKDFRFRTEFYLGGGIHGNVAHGGLYVKGFGDPTIDLEKLELIAKRIKNLGVNRNRRRHSPRRLLLRRNVLRRGLGPGVGGRGVLSSGRRHFVQLQFRQDKGLGLQGGYAAYVSAEPKEFPFAIKSRVLTSRRRSGVMAEFGSRNQIRLSGYVSSRRKRETLEMSVPTRFSTSARCFGRRSRKRESGSTGGCAAREFPSGRGPCSLIIPSLWASSSASTTRRA